MCMVFDLNIVIIDFFCKEFILFMICSIKEFCIGEWYNCDFCIIVVKVVEYFCGIGIVDIVYFGFEVEFFFFDDICFG